MRVIDTKSDQDVLLSLLAEVAKATNEIKCAQSDLAKSQSRLSFALACINELLYRQGIQR